MSDELKLYCISLNGDKEHIVRAKSFSDAVSIMLDKNDKASIRVGGRFTNILVRNITISIYDEKLYERTANE